ncbi:MAG: DUF5017 domain-containing protein [Cytophagaceae bacterium]|jgi:hypothetical protein|nr:DUF5017 domain-containing protein [Cytophagaceae bacterium]
MKLIKLLQATGIALFVISCEKEVAETPVASITINKTEFTINETMEINFTGVADQVTVFPGDNMQNYDLREQSNTGLVVNKKLFTYAYAVPGVFKVVCVASTHTENAAELKYDTCSVTVTVTDDVTEINRISCPQVRYDEVFAEKMADDNWLMILPRRIKLGTSTPAINIARQRLRFYIPSDSTKVSIDGKSYSNTQNYDLSVPLDILVKSNAGTERPYKLYTVNYAEFASFKLLGATGTLVRNEYDYSTFVMEVTLPTGTDVSNAVPEFTTTAPTEKVYIGDKEQTSGTSAVDFTKDVIYRLVSTSADNPAMQAESTVSVKIRHQ